MYTCDRGARTRGARFLGDRQGARFFFDMFVFPAREPAFLAAVVWDSTEEERDGSRQHGRSERRFASRATKQNPAASQEPDRLAPDGSLAAQAERIEGSLAAHLSLSIYIERERDTHTHIHIRYTHTYNIIDNINMCLCIYIYI